MNYWHAAELAEQRPFGTNGRKPTSDEDFTRYSTEPLRSQTIAEVTDLSATGELWRGSPPQARIKVVAVEVAANPWPTVKISNCPTHPSDWVRVDAKTGKPAPTVAPPGHPAKPPYRSTYEVIYYLGRWLVHDMTTDRSHTCTGP